MAEIKLVGRREKQTPHVDREQVGAVPASYSDRLEEAAARNTHLQMAQIKTKKITYLDMFEELGNRYKWKPNWVCLKKIKKR